MWALGRLSNCTVGSTDPSCALLDLTSPTVTSLQSSATDVATLVANPLNPGLRNRIVPLKVRAYLGCHIRKCLHSGQ